MRARAVALVVGVVAALLLASAGGGLAMQLGPEEAVAVIPAIDVDRATIQKRVEARRAELRSQMLAQLVKPGNQQALLRYLRRHTDIDPSRVVIQRGKRNYAGPNCPGRAWNCTTARQVVQISLDDDDDGNNDNGGGANTFSCEPSAGPDNPCVVIQPGTGGNNYAECVQRTNDMSVVALSCSITQTNIMFGSNTARIEQDANHSSAGGVQNVTETAVLTQTAVNGNNRAVVVQDVDLTMRGTTNQMQDAHQRAELDLLNQGGDNSAVVRQTQDLFGEQIAPIVDQRQNTLPDPGNDCVGIQEPESPNSCARINMNTGGGDNDLDLDQSNDLTMSVGGGDGEDDDGGDDDNGDDNGDDGGDDDNGDDNGDDDNGGSSSVTGFQQQGTCEVEPCTVGDDPDGGTEAGIDLFSTSGNTNSHMTGLASADMPGNTPLIEQLQFTDPWCCYGTLFTGDSVRSEIDLEAFMDGGEDTYQTGENGLGCIAEGGECIAHLQIRTEDGTFSASGQGSVLFAHQQCTHTGGPVITQEGPECEDPEFTTTTDTFTDVG
jgi:hypothetical protein